MGSRDRDGARPHGNDIPRACRRNDERQAGVLKCALATLATAMHVVTLYEAHAGFGIGVPDTLDPPVCREERQ